MHAITAGRNRIVLAMLLLEPRRILPVDRLVQAVWHDRPPPTARGQIQICISTLRRQLDAAGLGDPIRTCTPGYLLEVPPDDIDLHRFEQWADEGLRAAARNDLEAASQLLSGALALWRGPAMAGVDSRLVQAATTGLSERRLAVLERYAELQLRLGRGAAVVGTVAEFAAEHPLREGLIALQMAALFTSGRQADALQVYRSARQRLVEELAIEPGAQLRELEQAILRGDRSHHLLAGPATDGPVSLGPVDLEPAGGEQPQPEIEAERFDLPPDARRQPLAGREAELAALREQLRDGDRPAVLLTGITGSGKTRLAAELAAGWPDPYRYLDVAGLSLSEVQSAVLRALAPAADQSPDRLDCRELLGRTPLLLVVDGVAEQGVLDALLPPAGAAGALLAVSPVPLAVPAGALWQRLSPLSSEQSLAVLEAAVGRDRLAMAPAGALHLAELAGGHAGVLAGYAAALAEHPGLSPADLAAEAVGRADLLDPVLAAGLAASCAWLGADARVLLRRLTLLPSADSFGAWVCPPLLDRVAERTRPALDELCDSGLVEQHGDRYTLGRPAHDFGLRLRAEEESPAALAAAERRLLTVLLARLVARERAITDPPLPFVPATSGVAGVLGTPPPATGYGLAHEIGLVRTAVERAWRLGADELCWQLGFVIARLLEPTQLCLLAEGLLRHATAAADRADDRRGQAAMLQISVRTRAFGGDLAGARARARVAVELFEDLGDPAAAAHLRRCLAELQLAGGELEAAIENLRRCVTRFGQFADTAGQALSLLALSRALERAEQPVSAQRCRHRLTELVTASTQTRLAQHVITELGALAGDLRAAPLPERNWA